MSLEPSQPLWLRVPRAGLLALRWEHDPKLNHPSGVLLGDPKAHQAIPFEPFDTNRKRQRPVVQLMMRKDAQANIEVSNRKALDPRARAKGLGGAQSAKVHWRLHKVSSPEKGGGRKTSSP